MANNRQLSTNIVSVLQKLTPDISHQGMVKLSTDIRNFNTAPEYEDLNTMCNEIFEKGIEEEFSPICAKFLEYLNVTVSYNGAHLTLKNLLFERCLKEFEREKWYHYGTEEISEIRLLGAIHLVSEIFKNGMWRYPHVIRIVIGLLSRRTEITVECICRLIQLIGDEIEDNLLDTNSKQYAILTNIYAELLFVSTVKETPDESKSLIKEVIEPRKDSFRIKIDNLNNRQRPDSKNRNAENTVEKKLRQEILDFKSQVKQLRIKLDRPDREKKKLHKQISDLRKSNDRLKVENHNMKAEGNEECKKLQQEIFHLRNSNAYLQQQLSHVNVPNDATNLSRNSNYGSNASINSNNAPSYADATNKKKKDKIEPMTSISSRTRHNTDTKTVTRLKNDSIHSTIPVNSRDSSISRFTDTRSVCDENDVSFGDISYAEFASCCNSETATPRLLASPNSIQNDISVAQTNSQINGKSTPSTINELEKFDDVYKFQPPPNKYEIPLNEPPNKANKSTEKTSKGRKAKKNKTSSVPEPLVSNLSVSEPLVSNVSVTEPLVSNSPMKPTNESCPSPVPSLQTVPQLQNINRETLIGEMCSKIQQQEQNLFALTKLLDTKFLEIDRKFAQSETKNYYDTPIANLNNPISGSFQVAAPAPLQYVASVVQQSYCPATALHPLALQQFIASPTQQALSSAVQQSTVSFCNTALPAQQSRDRVIQKSFVPAVKQTSVHTVRKSSVHAVQDLPSAVPTSPAAPGQQSCDRVIHKSFVPAAKQTSVHTVRKSSVHAVQDLPSAVPAPIAVPTRPAVPTSPAAPVISQTFVSSAKQTFAQTVRNFSVHANQTSPAVQDISSAAPAPAAKTPVPVKKQASKKNYEPLEKEKDPNGWDGDWDC